MAPAAFKWDCMSVRADLNPDRIAVDPVFAFEFNIIDMWYKGDSPTNLIYNSDVLNCDSNCRDQTDASVNWRPVASLSEKNCIEDPNAQQPDEDADWKVIQCSRVNAHWFRHFTTDSEDQDIQLDVEKVPADIVKIVGF